MRNLKQKSANQRKPLITASLVVAVLILGAISYIVYAQASQPNTQSNTLNGKGDTLNPTEAKESSEENYSNETTDKIPENSNASVTINNLKQVDNEIVFDATITSTAGDGKCSLVLTNPNDKPVSRTIKASIVAGKSQCGPITIPSEEFSLLGEWTATLRYYTNGTQTVASKTIIIE